MMVLDHVGLHDKKCYIRESSVFLPRKNHAAKHCNEFVEYFQSDLVMEDFMNASEGYIPCCYCSNFNLEFGLLLQGKEQTCPKLMLSVPKQHYCDFVTDQGLYYYN